MSVGSKDEKRPTSAVKNAHNVFQMATGEVEDGKPKGDEFASMGRVVEGDQSVIADLPEDWGKRKG